MTQKGNVLFGEPERVEWVATRREGTLESEFREFFRKATGKEPFPYQVRLALKDPLPNILHIPTGGGKTYAVLAAWLWRRKRGVDKDFPRRLVYCLPVRVLVEQTYEIAKNFMEKSGFSKIGVYKLLGGEVEEEWHSYPEREAVLIGTQDMLLSRALNRGFAQSRFAWPLDFALLNNDCLWVFDEIQLMGSGLATSAQLAAFRERFGVWGKCVSIWISATLNSDWLRTIDFQDRIDDLVKVELSDEDLNHGDLTRRMNAYKKLNRYPGENSMKEITQFLKSKHRPGTTTLAILNTVERSIDLYSSLANAYKRGEDRPEIILIHSRFRGAERAEKSKKISDKLVPPEGRIIVSTQVVEAGVDITSAVLFTELAPWPAIVQRLGRCNRYGEHEEAEAIWLDLEEKKYPPYEDCDMDQARYKLQEHENKLLSPMFLHSVPYTAEPKYRFVIRKKDIEELYDNTPDLTGHDIDVSRFVRDVDALDLQVFWRDFEDEPGLDMPSPSQEELCPVPYYEFRAWLKKEIETRAYTWDYLEGRWTLATNETLWPGTLVLLHCGANGYDPERGWFPKARGKVTDISKTEVAGRTFDSTSTDNYYEDVRVTLREHSINVRDTLKQITDRLRDVLSLPDGLKDHYQDLLKVLLDAALLHDAGKASSLFQKAIMGDHPGEPLAKGKMIKGRFRYGRKYFRHELVSALLVLQNGDNLGWWAKFSKTLSLLAFLVAAHHGKVRCAIRALPSEDAPPDGRRYALGVWEGDEIDRLSIGSYHLPPTLLKLDCMELGISDSGEQSWVERCAELLNDFGPFRLAYLETLVRSADIRASEEEVSRSQLQRSS